LGAVGAATVSAAFYNFHPAMVAKAVPACWEVVTPADLAVQRTIAAGDALAQLCSPDSLHQLSAALPLLRRAVEHCGRDGRTMTGANRTLCMSLGAQLAERGLGGTAGEVAEAWQACTALREHRGDGHVAALLSHGISGLAAHLLAAGAAAIPVETLRDNRGWSERDWSVALADLSARGWLDHDGRATSGGLHLRQSVESLTDQLAEVPLASLSDQEVAALHGALRAGATEIQGSGLLPFPNPMGLPELD
jgi:hypothetical protein